MRNANPHGAEVLAYHAGTSVWQLASFISKLAILGTLNQSAKRVTSATNQRPAVFFCSFNSMLPPS